VPAGAATGAPAAAPGRCEIFAERYASTVTTMAAATISAAT
jgi:hypothetical protein